MPIYANDYAAHDGVLRLHLIAHGPVTPKADAFLIALDGEYYLIDGGMTANTGTYEYLIRLRAALLDRAPAGTHAPLRINWVVSHFHQDHIGATLDYVIRDRRIEFDRIYLPPRSAIDPKYPDNGDNKYRGITAELIARMQPQATVIDVGFGHDAKLVIPYGDGGEITIYPPDRDWGLEENLAYMVDNYYDGNWEKPNIAVAAVNACSQWMGIRYGGRQCLFTGDTMKRKAKLDAEAFDTMYALWGAEIGQVDVLKYLHHGVARDKAARGMLKFQPKRVIVTHSQPTAPEALREVIAEDGGTMPEIIACGDRSYVLEIAADGGIKGSWLS
ncbi:MAG: hypothetical protein IJX53_08040 [Clostridia bacterium]|nr:hypothetical protein [Clostridia bacterium]